MSTIKSDSRKRILKWLSKTFAEELGKTAIRAIIVLVPVSLLFGSVRDWIWQSITKLLTTPIEEWSGSTIATVLLLISLVLATSMYLLYKIYARFSMKFRWVEYGGFQWKAWKHKEPNWYPFCPDCFVETVRPELQDFIFCPICNKRWAFDYFQHRAYYDAAKNKAVAIFQKHLKTQIAQHT